jgi:hypothetical protein
LISAYASASVLNWKFADSWCWPSSPAIAQSARGARFASRTCYPLSTVTKSRIWHVEEFFKFNQALGWHRAGTLNLNIRYGQMTMALVAQAAIHQMRQRLGEPFSHWDVSHLARDIFGALEGDVRVKKFAAYKQIFLTKSKRVSSY